MKLIADELCEVCLGSGMIEEPQVIFNPDGPDTVLEPKISRCRCVEEVDNEDEDEGMIEDDEEEVMGNVLL